MLRACHLNFLIVSVVGVLGSPTEEARLNEEHDWNQDDSDDEKT